MNGDDDELARAVLRHGAGRTDAGDLTPRHGWSNRAWVGDDVVVRISSGRLERSLAHEAEVCAVLHHAGLTVARPIAVGDVEEVRPGEPGEWLVSERLPGETLADAWPDLGPEQRRTAGEDLGRFLHTLHTLHDDAGAALDLAPPWWTQAHQPGGYHNAYRPDVAIAVDMAVAAKGLPFADATLLDAVIGLIEERLPHFDDDTKVFTHGDVHGHNLLVDPATGRLTGVLDWEGAHPAAADLELDMLTRWVGSAHAFPARPGGPARITAKGDADELLTHVRAAYPELFAHPHLVERLELHEVQWQLVQLHFEAYWLGLGHGHGDPSVPSASWDELRRLVPGA